MQPDRAEPFVERVTLRNYKSIGHCDVKLGHLTFLVGRNGSGKSNFLDALRFLVDALENSLDHAIKSRGGIDEVRRRSTGHPRNFAIQLHLNLDHFRVARYGFEIGAQARGGFHVKSEQLRIFAGDGTESAMFDVQAGKVHSRTHENMPPLVPDRLYLVNAAGFPDFRPVYDGLLALGFYNLNPQAMKELQSPDAGELLHRDGSNVSSVIGRMAADRPELKSRIQAYLATIVPGITGVERVALGPKETLAFHQDVQGAQHSWKFYATSMSDGTLRALGTLVAVTQLALRNSAVRLVGIEEPETALHPAAAAALIDALREAAVKTQIVVTTHSPDLMDQVRPSSGEIREDILVVQQTEGTTAIAPIDPASRQAIHEHLYSPGELLRMDQFELDPDDLSRQQQLPLAFSSEELP